MDDLTSGIKALAKREGVSLVGIAFAGGWEAARGRRPTDILPDAESVVVMAIQIPDRAIDDASLKERQSVRRAIDKELDRVGAEIIEVLAENGFNGLTAVSPIYKTGYLDIVNGEDEFNGLIAVPPVCRTPELPAATSKSLSPDWEYLQGSTPLKYAAQMAGLGVIGKNSLLITPQYGPRVRLAAIITNVQLTPDKPLSIDLCEKCMVCEKVCIAKAIREGRLDIEMCWRAEMELGEPVPGTPFKLCPAPCLKFCPAGKLTEKWQIA